MPYQRFDAKARYFSGLFACPENLLASVNGNSRFSWYTPWNTPQDGHSEGYLA
jgi:hypothetical protein